jgi:hypothetical protein
MREFKSPDLLGTKAKVAEQKKHDDEYMRKVKGAAKRVFESNEDGRLLFKFILDYCDVFKMTMTGNSWTFFNEGKRDVGLMLLGLREAQWEDEVTQRREEHLQKMNKESKL